MAQYRCCIAGGGPAGMMLGYLLARAGVETIVLEKHADFLRDFRGDTIHPSTLELMYELGVLDELLKRPHQEVQQLTANVGETEMVVADFSHLPTHCRFIALMPQWDFLDFIAEQARHYPSFHLKMQAEVIGLIEEGGRVAGVQATSRDGPLEIRADVVIGADGRHSLVRDRSGLEVDEFGAPMDVLWMRMSRHASDPESAIRFDRGKGLVMLNRGDYWQCGFLIPKGGFDEIRKKGIEELRAGVVELAPFTRDRVGELRDWNDIKLLTVKIDRLRRWYRPGLLCIGDAAHAMSPVGGVGINLAIQDAVAAANIMAAPLREGAVTNEDLAKVQHRRMLPTRLTQGLQVVIQKRLIARVLGASGPVQPPWPMPLLARSGLLGRLLARIVGVGFRAEHIAGYHHISRTDKG